MTQAKRDPKTAAEPAAPVSEQPEQPSAPAEPVDDVRARFKAALERKNATPGTHPGSQVDGGTAMKSSNGKKKREFRRKAGG